MKPVNPGSLDCRKLTSLEYRGCGLDLEALYININTPMLKSINHSAIFPGIPNAFAFFATLPELEILHLDICLKVTTSLKITQPLKHLKQLSFIIDWDILQRVEFDLLWILTILQASPLLQKLSFMIAYPKFFESQKDIKNLEVFSHDEIKVIEMGGCVGNWYEIGFVMNVLKYAPKLERIVLSPYCRHHDSLDWNSNPVWFQNGRERIRKKLEGEVIGRVELI